MAVLIYGTLDSKIVVQGEVEQELPVRGPGPHRLSIAPSVTVELTHGPGGWALAVLEGSERLVHIPAPGGAGVDAAGIPLNSERAVILGRVSEVTLLS